jgi:hypothetical protein
MIGKLDVKFTNQLNDFFIILSFKFKSFSTILDARLKSNYNTDNAKN